MQDDVILILVKQQVAALCLVLQNSFAKNKLLPPRMGWNLMEPNDGLHYIWAKSFQKELTEEVLLFRTKHQGENAQQSL